MYVISTEPIGAGKHRGLNRLGSATDLLLSMRLGASVEDVA